MLKIRRPLGRLIFNMEIAIPGKTVFLIETGVSQGFLLMIPSSMIGVARARARADGRNPKHELEIIEKKKLYWRPTRNPNNDHETE